MSAFLVLTASVEAGLSDALAAAVATRIDGDLGVRRLTPSAVEIAVDRAPVLEPLRAAFPQIDVNAVPMENRRKRLLIADMDQTMITVECIDEIADIAGVGADVAAITKRTMAGEIDFEEALIARVALLARLEVSVLDQVFEERIRLTQGARTLVQTMAATGAHTMLISGGFTFYTERVAAAAGFAEHRANTLEIVNGRLTGRVVPPILGREAKREALDAALEHRGLSRDEALAVGDGANDLAMITAAGLGVAFRAKPILADAADARIEHAGLEALLPLQGYTAAERVAG
ncbi:MAG: phosphoserine phosphatase SerB [Pseudomonadota bacterium]